MKHYSWMIGLVLWMPSGVWAASITNLDTIAHRMQVEGQEPFVLAPNQTWEQQQADMKVRILDSAHPDRGYHLQDRDVWVIWPKGEFGMQMRRQSSSSNR